MSKYAAQNIVCPHCNQSFDLEEAMSHDLEKNLREAISADYEKKIQRIEKQFEKDQKEKELLLKVKLEKKLKREQQEITEELEQSEQENQKLRKQQVELKKSQKELERKEKDFQLALDEKLLEKEEELAQQIQLEANKVHNLEILKKDKQLEGLNKKIEELSQKMTQGSQKLQGDLKEIQIEQVLQDEFPRDKIERAGVAQKGGDLNHTILDNDGSLIGKIIWEVKETKAWQNNWITKLKKDQKEQQADMAIIVTRTLPKGMQTIGNIEGVYVTSVDFVVLLATLLREQLVNIHKAKSLADVTDSHLQELFAYLTSNQFVGKLEMLAESYFEMKGSLDKEKASLIKMLEQREQQLNKMLKGIGGVYGGLQGQTNSALPEIKILELN